MDEGGSSRGYVQNASSLYVYFLKLERLILCSYCPYVRMQELEVFFKENYCSKPYLQPSRK